MNPILEELEPSVQHPLAVRLVTMALNALSSRALVWMASIGAACLWTVAMLDPAWIKLAIATGYCATVLLPILVRDSKSG